MGLVLAKTLYSIHAEPQHASDTAQEYEAVSQAGSLFRSTLYAFHGGSLTTMSAEIGFT